MKTRPLLLTLLGCFAILTPFTNIFADTGRYAIVEADGRTFLLDTQNGRAWRYYYNGVGKGQGWESTYFDSLVIGDEEFYSMQPYGDRLRCPASSK